MRFPLFARVVLGLPFSFGVYGIVRLEQQGRQQQVDGLVDRRTGHDGVHRVVATGTDPGSVVVALAANGGRQTAAVQRDRVADDVVADGANEAWRHDGGRVELLRAFRLFQRHVGGHELVLCMILFFRRGPCRGLVVVAALLFHRRHIDSSSSSLSGRRHGRSSHRPRGAFAVDREQRRHGRDQQVLGQLLQRLQRLQWSVGRQLREVSGRRRDFPLRRIVAVRRGGGRRIMAAAVVIVTETGHLHHRAMLVLIDARVVSAVRGVDERPDVELRICRWRCGRCCSFRLGLAAAAPSCAARACRVIAERRHGALLARHGVVVAGARAERRECCLDHGAVLGRRA